ncbi:VOC family protein [Roseomonas elaeocarpi]|uniref:VOC family protein n=1 Tax=Roseomonas elaeocarpi TaxID=907779 RepID=A0ABV6JTC1_9PROT
MADFTWDHLHLRSTDPVAAARFYVEMFGATETSRVENNGALRVVLSLSGIPLFIEQVPEGTGAPPSPPYLGFEHIGLRVADLEATAAALRAKGATFTMEPNSPRPGLRMAFVQAPDGARVELLERSAV